jgi:putative RecB family exonuclease
MEDPTTLRPEALEVRVSHVLEDASETGEPVELRGIVDRLDVSASGALRVVDYKTGRAPGVGFESTALFQMKFYALLLLRSRGVLPKQLKLLYLNGKESLTYQPEESELDGFERRVKALWQAIRRAELSGDWRPKKSKLCDWCDHQALCPEFGGTPPPLPVVSTEL